MQGQFLGVGYDLLITMIGLLVAGMAAIIGIWVERDPKRPPRYAIWLSVLITLATGVSMYQTYDDDQDQKKVEADLARVLQQMDKIASTSAVDLPELNDLLKTELAAQSRGNPSVVRNFAQRVADEGGDPAEVVASYLPESEVQGMQRSGTFKVKPAGKPTPAAAVAVGTAEAAQAPPVGADAQPRAYARRKKLTFGGGAPQLRDGGETAQIKPTQRIEEKKDVVAQPSETATAAASAASPTDDKADEKAKLSLGGLKGLDKETSPADRLRLGGLKGTAPTAPATGAPHPPTPGPAPTQPAAGGPKLGGLKGIKH